MKEQDENTGVPHFHFPAVSVRTAELPLDLPPFAGFPNGWAGTLESFLASLRGGAISLEWAPLAAVVDQYLGYRERLLLDEAGEFLHVASSLIDWKTRLLLPRDPMLAEPDPREEIVRTLESGERQPPPSREPSGKERDAEHEIASGLSLLDLMLLLHEVEQSAMPMAAGVPLPEVTVADQLAWLLDRISGLPRQSFKVEPWFALHPSLPAKLCLFLALLELSRKGWLRLEQQTAFGPVTAVPV